MDKNKPYKTNCLQCGNKYTDCRDLVFCTIKVKSVPGNGFLYRKGEYKKTPKWCPLKQIGLTMLK